MMISDEALLMNHRGDVLNGPTPEILTEENIARSFDMEVVMEELCYNGRTIRSIVPVALRREESGEA